MIPRSLRFSRSELSSLGRPKHVVHSTFASVRVFPVPTGGEGARFVVSITKKEVASATGRNRLRRRYAAIVSEALASATRPTRLSIVIKRSAENAAYHELQADVAAALEKMRI